MIKLSTGMRNAMLGSIGAKVALTGAVLRIYSGAEPASPDDALAVGNTELAVISLDGTGAGVSFEEPADGILVKANDEIWRGTVLQDGVPSFYRLVPLNDTGEQSTAFVRVQGSIGPAGDLLLGATELTTGAPQTIDYYQLSLPSF